MRLEDRLRDAYREEAHTVTPESILRLGDAIAAQSPQSAQSPRSARFRRVPTWGRWLAPLTAAAAVAVIVVVAAVAIPRGTGRSQPSVTTAGAPKFLIGDSTGVSPLAVRNATTGALVARVTVPRGTQATATRTSPRWPPGTGGTTWSRSTPIPASPGSTSSASTARGIRPR